MCSIFALLGYAGSETAARDLALGQSRLLRHRGPDWSGLYADERVVLAHERLAIVEGTEWAEKGEKGRAKGTLKMLGIWGN